MHAVTASLISERAYSIWEQEGRPTDKALEHWLQAEAELKSTMGAPQSSGSQPAKVAAAKAPQKRPTRKSRS